MEDTKSNIPLEYNYDNNWNYTEDININHIECNLLYNLNMHIIIDYSHSYKIVLYIFNKIINNMKLKTWKKLINYYL